MVFHRHSGVYAPGRAWRWPCKGFLFLALCALQPADALMSHDAGDFAIHKALSDAIRGGGGGRAGFGRRREEFSGCGFGPCLRTTSLRNNSNTLNYCVIWFAPKRKFAAIAVSNTGGDQTMADLVKRYVK